MRTTRFAQLSSVSLWCSCFTDVCWSLRVALDQWHGVFLAKKVFRPSCQRSLDVQVIPAIPQFRWIWFWSTLWATSARLAGQARACICARICIWQCHTEAWIFLQSLLSNMDILMLVQTHIFDVVCTLWSYTWQVTQDIHTWYTYILFDLCLHTVFFTLFKPPRGKKMPTGDSRLYLSTGHFDTSKMRCLQFTDVL